MAQRLTDSIVKKLAAPAKGNKVHYDAAEPGFGARVTSTGARAFILNYRTRSGRERRFTIGSFPTWSVSAARQEAKRLKQDIDRGGDPLAEVQAQREAPTVADLCARYTAEHMPRKRASSQHNDALMIAANILPSLRHLKVGEVTFADIDGLHRRLTHGTKDRRGVPVKANRVIALLGKMFQLAIRWGWRTDNPVRGIERNQETKRRRYLSTAELARLTEALAAHEDQQAANIIRLLLLTGARRGEVQSARWADINIEERIWIKPASTTKQRQQHQVPLSPPALQLLVELKADATSEFVFPGARGREHRVSVQRTWRELCKAAGITGARPHDLRHTYASVLASSGMSLPIIGALLGHTQPGTTARYAHLFDDPLRKATETAGAIITGKPSAEVVQIKSR